MAKKENLTPIDLPITKFKRCHNCSGMVLNDDTLDMPHDDDNNQYCCQECLEEALYDPCEADNFASEVEQGAWTTEDGCKYYQHGKLVLDTTDMEPDDAGDAAQAIMDSQGFYPNVFYVSDHGNVSLTTVT